MNINLRAFKFSDAESVAKYANNINISQFLTNQFPHPYSLENAIAFIEMATSHNPQHVFCIDVEGEAIGGIGVHPQKDVSCKNAELGYWVAEPFWGNGIATSVIPKVVDYGFANFNITRIYARVYENNIASAKVLLKCNFEVEASFEKTIFKNGVFLNELIFAIRK